MTGTPAATERVTPAHDDRSGDMVPAHWPPSEPPPAVHAARPVSWLLMPLAVPGVFLCPTRIGPRLSQSTWTKAVAVHLLSLLLAGMVALAADVVIHRNGSGVRHSQPIRYYQFEHIGWARLTPAEWLRLPFALSLTTLFDASENLDAKPYVITAVSLHAAVWLAAVLVMPLLATGERLRLLFARCCRLTLWSSVIIPAAVLFYSGVQVMVEGDLGAWTEGVTRFVPGAGAKLALTLLIFMPWWFSVLCRLAARYAGSTDGPGWQPAAPRCVGCGYSMVGLSPSGRCPECGRAVAESLPTVRVQPPWFTAAGRWDRCRAYWATARAVIGDREFFRTLPVRRPTRDAARFAVWTCIAAGVILTVGVAAPSTRGSFGPDEGGLAWATTAALLAWVGTTALALAVVCAAAWRWTLAAPADPRVGWNAVLYASPHMLPIAMATAAALWLDRWLDRFAPFLQRAWGNASEGFVVTAEWLVWLGVGALVLGVSVWSLLRLRQAILDVRYAAA